MRRWRKLRVRACGAIVGARHASPANAVRIVSILLFGRGMPRPYKALRKQGYRGDFTTLTGRTRITYIAIIHSKTSLSVIAGEALYLSSTSILRARRASPLQSLAEARLTTKGDELIS